MSFWTAATYMTVDRSTPLPTLRYDSPPGFHRAHGPGPDHYSSRDGTASVQIYQFRPFAGDIVKQFRRTMLSDWIEPLHRETNVVGRPMFGCDAISGARAVLTVRFIEAVSRLPREHIRFLVIVGRSAALIDVSTDDADALQRVAATLTAMFTSMRVEEAPGDPR